MRWWVVVYLADLSCLENVGWLQWLAALLVNAPSWVCRTDVRHSLIKCDTASRDRQ